MPPTTYSNGESQTSPVPETQTPNEDEQQYLDLIAKIIAKGKQNLKFSGNKELNQLNFSRK